MRILLVGATGAMGKMVAQVAEEYDNAEIVAGIANDSLPTSFPLYRDFADVKENFDCIIDFSNCAATPALLDFIEASGKRAVIGTTNLSDEIKARIAKIGERTPILYTQNMSLGVNTIDNVVKYLANALVDFDIEIIEKHHNKKTDAPSGTAEMLFRTIQSQRAQAYEINDRSTKNGKRDKNEVGVLSLRGGTIVGEHSVIFAGIDEVIEIKHTAGSKKVFANGALQAALFLMRKESGFYSMKDVLAGE